jgi:hypothetical protein
MIVTNRRDLRSARDPHMTKHTLGKHLISNQDSLLHQTSSNSDAHFSQEP